MRPPTPSSVLGQEAREALADFVQKRDALLTRRKELRDELALIEAALEPLIQREREDPKRRAPSVVSIVEAYLIDHPNSLLGAIAAATHLDRTRVATALYNMTRRGRLARTRTVQGWSYSVNKSPTG